MNTYDPAIFEALAAFMILFNLVLALLLFITWIIFLVACSRIGQIRNHTRDTVTKLGDLTTRLEHLQPPKKPDPSDTRYQPR